MTVVEVSRHPACLLTLPVELGKLLLGSVDTHLVSCTISSPEHGDRASCKLAHAVVVVQDANQSAVGRSGHDGIIAWNENDCKQPFSDLFGFLYTGPQPRGQERARLIRLKFSLTQDIQPA